MALEFIGGTLFTQLYDGVKQAMSKSGRFKTLLGDLKSTLDSLEPRDIQQIGEHNVELGLPNEEIESLQMQMEDGVKLVGKLSNFRIWNYCCLDDYAQQIVELDRALKRLLIKLKMQEARDVKEVWVLSRQNREKLDEVNRRLLDIRKLLQQRAGDVVVELVSISITETVPDQAQGNVSEQGAALQATFAVLCDVVMEVKDKNTAFKPLIENLMSTLDSLRPLMEDILEYRKLLDRQDECKNFRIQMEKGVELVHKCSKVGILRVQVARDVRETFISIRNIEAVIKRIEESGVLQNQTQADGWCALPEPSLPTIGSDVLNMQGASDARETLVLSGTTKAGVEEIEGIGTEQTPCEITVDSPSLEVSSYPLSTTVTDSASSFGLSSYPFSTTVTDSASSFGLSSYPFSTTVSDSASSFGLSSFPASPLQVPPIPINSMSSKLSRFGSVHLSLKQIAKATRNFSRSQQVGEGNFGTVYKAWLDDGQVVSIKRAKKEHFENLQTEFSSEVELLAKIDHRNLVKLLGYVDEGNERLIITEYVPNGTLREHLDRKHGKILKFNQRLEIAIDVAHALTYLHTYAEKQIIHRDVKSSNILLTESMKAKVADFGIARLGPVETDETHISTEVKGTVGYIDPEYMKTYQLTPKSDVYSFGILLIEIFTGRRPVESKRPAEERVTLRWAFKKLNEGRVAELVDPLMEETIDAELLMKIFDLGIQCAAPIRDARPDMKAVGEQLWTIRAGYLRSVKRGQ
ncbi:calmodulin-binding receptor-like cytoplasmic kinase 2 isoform X3 [Malus sylvestris]|uniref:calmodulin-binding receptor-like cytoplasmic kinase 2 isoform X3 n=1 Tax=Malus sylvestris TaxID=3752 RepID=UPI0021ACD20A|nr:calmodulin-binding receptor-like cytoplasmic kinase 2 isoform X3 [Malus sylvestris]